MPKSTTTINVLALLAIFLATTINSFPDGKFKDKFKPDLPDAPPWPSNCEDSCKIFETYIITTRYLFRNMGCSIKDILCFPDDLDPYDPTGKKDKNYKDPVPYIRNDGSQNLIDYDLSIEEVKAYLDTKRKENDPSLYKNEPHTTTGYTSTAMTTPSTTNTGTPYPGQCTQKRCNEWEAIYQKFYDSMYYYVPDSYVTGISCKCFGDSTTSNAATSTYSATSTAVSTGYTTDYTTDVTTSGEIFVGYDRMVVSVAMSFLSLWMILN